jgi:hypothetical protein
MKKRVRIYKAQTGMQMPKAVTDEQIVEDAITLISQQKIGIDKAEQYLTQVKGYDPKKTRTLLSGLSDYLDSQNKLQAATVTGNEMEAAKLAEEEAEVQRQAEADVARKQRLQAMYNSEFAPQDYAEEDQFMQDNVLARSGGFMSKKQFVKKATKLAKKDIGGDTPNGPNKADSTDTGERGARLNDFVSGLQTNANKAKLEEDAEALYDLATSAPSVEPTYDMAYSQLGSSMPGLSRRQERQLNRSIRNTPMAFYGQGSGFGLPAMAGVPDYAPMGSQNPYMQYMGAPNLASFEMLKTGLFGRPKSWIAKFNPYSLPGSPNAAPIVPTPQAAPSQSTKKVINYNDADITKLLDEEPTVAEDETVVTTPGAEEDITEDQIKVVTKKGTKKTEKVYSPKEELEEVKVTPRAMSFEESPYAYKSISSRGFQNDPWSNALEERYKQATAIDKSKATKSKYDGEGNAAKVAANAKKVAENAAKVRANAAKVEKNRGKYNFYEEDDPWGAGNPDSGWIANEIGFQVGGFTQEGSGLNKFVYGGDEAFGILPSSGKLIDSPFFEDGGLYKAQKGYWQNGQWTQGVNPRDAAELSGANPYKSNLSYTSQQQYNQPQIGMTPDEWRLSQGQSMGINPAANNVVWDGTNWSPKTGYGQQNVNLPNNNPYIGNQYVGNQYAGTPVYGSMPMMYPPLFGGRRAITRAGSWAQQRGLPQDVATGQAYTGPMMNPEIAQIRVDKSRGRRQGYAPKKYTIDYMVDDWDPNGTAAAAATTDTQQQNLSGDTFADRLLNTGNKPLSWVGSKLKPFETQPTAGATGTYDKYDENYKKIYGYYPDQQPQNAIDDSTFNFTAPDIADVQYPDVPSTGTFSDMAGSSLPTRSAQTIQQNQNEVEPQRPALDQVGTLPIRRPNQLLLPSQTNVAPGTEGPMYYDQAQQVASNNQGLNLLNVPYTSEDYYNESGNQNSFDAQQAELQRMIEQNPDFYTQGVYNNPVFNPEDMSTSNIINFNPRPAQPIQTKTSVAPAPRPVYNTPRPKSKQQQISNRRTQQNITPVVAKEPEKVVSKKEAKVNKKEETPRVYIEPEGSVNYGGNEKAQAAEDEVRRQQEEAAAKRKQFEKSHGVDQATLELFRDLKTMKGTEAQQRAMLQKYPGLNKYYKPSKEEYGGYMAYGGTPMAVDGFETPVDLDPRFDPDLDFNYEDYPMDDDMAYDPIPEDLGTDAVDNRGQWDPSRMMTKEEADKIGVEYRDPGPKIDYGRKRISAKYKNKNMYNVDFEQLVNQFNTAANWGLNQLGQLGDRKKTRDLYNKFKSDAVYGTTAAIDKGTTDKNSGVMMPNQMISNLGRYGGSMYEEGGETYMSEDQVRKFLEEGGELEFI